LKGILIDHFLLFMMDELMEKEMSEVELRVPGDHVESLPGRTRNMSQNRTANPTGQLVSANQNCTHRIFSAPPS
jgi:hypothetical protein